MRLVWVLLSVIFVFQACSLDENTVALVGDYKITKEELRKHLATKYGNKESFKTIGLDDKKTLLNQLILRKQKLSEAYDKGYDNDPEIQQELTTRKNQMLANAYYEKHIVDLIVPDSLIRSAFEKTRYEVNASHVLISFSQLERSQNRRSKAEAYNLAKTISEQVRSGADIKDMALKYSDDQTKDKNKGNLGYFVWGKMVDEFQQAAYNLEINEVSEPVLSDFGYHVIQLHDKRENPNYNPDGFKKVKDDIKKRLYFKMRDRAKPMWDAHLKDLKEKYNFTLLTKNIEDFVKKNIEFKNSASLTIENIKRNFASFILAEWDDGKCTATDLINNYLKRYRSNPVILKSVQNIASIRRDVDQLSNFLLVAQVAEEMGYLDANIRQKLEEHMEYALVSLVDTKFVAEQKDITEEEMKQYYSENQSEFVLPDKMEMWEIFVKNERTAKQIYDYAKSGRDFEQLANAYSEDKNRAKNYGRLGLVSYTSRGLVSRKAFEAGPNKILEPFKSRGGWVIIKTGDKSDETLKSYEASKKRIISKIRSSRVKQEQNAMETYLSGAYPAEINSDLLSVI